MTLNRLFSLLLIRLITVYQRVISPVLGQNCRFQPSCSAYAVQALTRYGLIKGSHLSVLRLMRCHPWAKHGFDPVP